MDEQFLAGQFEANRSHLRAVAYRMLGSLSEADDAVQETWLRLMRSDVGAVGNLAGWLTTVTARVCLDTLRARKSRREEPLEEHASETMASQERAIDPAYEAQMAESVGLALLVVLQTLSPAERIAFVLHDMFDFPFDEISAIVGRTPTATRQLASRARRRVQGKPNVSSSDLAHQRHLADAFLAASRGGHFEQLLTLLDPQVVLRADSTLQARGASSELRGAESVAKFFLGRATGARLALVNGEIGAVVAPQGTLLLVIALTFTDGKVSEIQAIADPTHLQQLELATLNT